MLIQTHPSDWWYGLSEDSTQAPEDQAYKRNATTGITIFKEFAVHKKRPPHQKLKNLKEPTTKKQN